MRVVGLLLGLIIGIIGTSMASNALRQGSAFPHGVMAVTAHHLGAARDAVAAGKCARSDTEAHFRAVRVLADDIEPAFVPTGGDDALFARYAAQLREKADAALARSDDACPSLTEAVGGIGDACKACHRDFR